MEVRIDPEADAAYIRLRKGKVHRTEEVEGGFALDYSRAGRVIGIEVLHLARRAPGVVGVNIPDHVWKVAQAS